MLCFGWQDPFVGSHCVRRWGNDPCNIEFDDIASTHKSKASEKWSSSLSNCLESKAFSINNDSYSSMALFHVASYS